MIGRLRAEGLEERELQIHSLGHRLHHQVGLTNGFAHVGGGADSIAERFCVRLADAVLGAQPREAGVDPREASLDARRVDVLEDDVTSRRRAYLRDPVPHRPCAHDRDLLNAHAAERPCSGSPHVGPFSHVAASAS